jgi:putative nucleotidyltransferase with HDIG domain
VSPPRGGPLDAPGGAASGPGGDPLRALAALGQDGFLVGGAVRDRLLGRATSDFDVAVSGEPRRAARGVARAVGGHAFELSEGFATWRVVARDRSWQLDVLALHEGTIEADLAQRDLTVNAMAQPLAGVVAQPVDGVGARAGDTGSARGSRAEGLVDPFGGRRDLEAGRLRMVSPRAFAADPLRVLRLARLACELDFCVEPATAAAARDAAAALERVSPERVFSELKRIVVCDRVLAGLALVEGLGALAVVLPELSALRGVRQSDYHHLDVRDHTRAVLAAVIDFERDPEPWFGEYAGALDRFLSLPLANELTRWQALRFGALFHDIAKPETRVVSPGGRPTFIGHDIRGAEVAASVLARLRASQRLCEHVAALARHHLRLGFLVHEAPLSRRAVYRYLRVCEPVEVDVTVLSVADRVATRGRGAERAIERHVTLAREMIGDALRWREARPRPPLRGDELTRELGLAPGPGIGALLQALEEAAYAGEIGSREQALRHARAIMQGESVTGR